MKLKLLKKYLFLPPNPIPCFMPSVHIKIWSCKIFIKALLDTRVLAYFIDKYFIIKYILLLVKKIYHALVEIMDRWTLLLKDVIEEIQSFQVILRDQVSHIIFNIIQYLANSIVITLPWFKLHNPNVDWNLYKISSRSKYWRKKYHFLELLSLCIQQRMGLYLQYMLLQWKNQLNKFYKFFQVNTKILWIFL